MTQKKNKQSKWKTCWVNNIAATKSIHYDWKAVLSPPSIDNLHFMDKLTFLQGNLNLQ